MFHTCVHICNLLPHLIRNLVQSQRNNHDHIYHWASSSFPPILYRALFGLNSCLVHHMFVTGSAGSFVAGGTVYVMFGSAVKSCGFDSSGPGGAGNLASEFAVHFVAVVGFSFVGVVHFVPECLGYFAEFVFDSHHPNPPLYFYKWGNLVPSTFLFLWHCSSTRGYQFLALWLYLNGGIWSWCGQSFLNSNKFPDIFPASGHGVPAQVGILLSGWGCYLMYFHVEDLFFLSLLGHWELLWAVVQLCCWSSVNLGFTTTCTLFLFVGMSFLLLSVTFVSFLTQGFVLGWAVLDWSDWGWNFGPTFPSKSR